MLKVTVIYVGTIKEKYLTDAVFEYEKRLSTYCTINNICIKDEKLPEKASSADILSALHKEGERIITAIPPRAYTVALCVEGKQMSSENFSKKLSMLSVDGYSEVCFIIGGSDGLSNDVKNIAKTKLSISEMTFPHQLMRVILLEQIYRAFNIAAGGKYHK